MSCVLMRHALRNFTRNKFLKKECLIYWFLQFCRALKDADFILLLGARLNWMLHFGKSPRFSENVKIAQVDLLPEELGNNSKNCIQIQADLRSFCEQMNIYLDHHKAFDINHGTKTEWSRILKEKIIKNKSVIEKMANDIKTPLNYYAAYAQVGLFNLVYNIK